MNAGLHRSGVVARKEFIHIIRDPQTLIIVVLMPMIMMFLFGYALNADIRNAGLVMETPVPSPASRALESRLDASTFFAVTRVIPATNDPAGIFRSGDVRALLRLPPDFEAGLRRPGGVALQVVVDGSDPSVGAQMRGAVEAAVQKALLDHLDLKPPRILDQRTVVLYNPQQRSALFFVPGLMAVILLMISALLTSITLTREKETGTMGQLLITPLRPREIIAGKLLPYVILASLDGTLILAVGRVIFGVRVTGNPVFLALCSLIYIFTALSIGLLISAFAKRQQHAMMAALMGTMMPTIMLSGFIFPVASMPVALQVLSRIVPATYYLQIVRGVILKGVGWHELWQPLLTLSFEGLLLFGLSIRKFRVKL
jgi:ABC-2 type transport system permease protein